MCTVTLIARQSGFVLGMNRDEKLRRVKAFPPSIQAAGGRRALFPSEPGGGTWIGVNNQGSSCALINWYAISKHVAGEAFSRGKVAASVIFGSTASEVETRLKNLPLNQVNPFRLIGIFVATNEVFEWRWDLEKLSLRRHAWESQIWISSGFDEPGAQKTRARNFETARRQKSFGQVSWLRRLHRSHRPERGPYSTCMHRADAATVSYTEIEVSRTRAVIRYQGAAPCNHSRQFERQMKLRKLL